MPIELSHSCCPGKTNIVPPRLVRRDVLTLSKGTLEDWHCEGCKAVILVFHLKDAGSHETL